MRTRSWALLALPLPLLTGCDGTDADTVDAIQTEIALSPFNSCDALETYIEDTAVQEMRTNIDSWNDSRWWFGVPEASDGRASQNDGAAAPSAPNDYTDTNVQVEGVDEADFVKTDGTRIFVLAGEKLYLTRSWPAADLAVQDSIAIRGWPLEMFLDGSGRAIVFSSWWAGHSRGDVYCGPWGCGGGRSYTRVTVVETANDRLQVVRELVYPGQYVSSRRIDDSVRLVLRDQLRGPDALSYWPENFRGDPSRDRAAFEAELERLKDRNERLIRAQTLSDWLPGAYVEQRGTRTDLGLDCASFHRPNAPVRLGLTTVATLDLGPAIPRTTRTSVLGEVGEIYASRDTLFLASPHWWWWPRAGQQTHTYIHALDIRDPSRAAYVGSGGVPGFLLDQFSMDEHLGYLRVASTVSEQVDDGTPWGRFDVSNRVTVLGRHRGRLVEVGAVSDIAPTEMITSARFVGTRGFVVTFEQVDPLFTLDLTDPMNPRVIGELKVPGFSTYIHPLDDHHLLTIGVHLPDPGPNGQVDWSQRAMKLTIFDVGDFANPREKFTQTVGTANGWSEAAWEHKAFNYFPARKMLAIPFSDYNPRAGNYWDSFVSDLRLFHVDVTTGISPRGRVSLADLYVEHRYEQWNWRYSPWVRRSVMADDFAYAISDAGIRAVDMRRPERPVATARFDVLRAN